MQAADSHDEAAPSGGAGSAVRAETTSDLEPAVGSDTTQARRRRTTLSVALLLAVYAVLSLTRSVDGSLGTDTGAKVITLERMADDDTFVPEVGYWAEDADPDGIYHPLLDSIQNDEGQWINVTTLPLLVAARPLYDVGGLRLAMLWPMLGGALTAWACSLLATRLGASTRVASVTFWMVGLGSPVVVYALDFWEHSLGAGLLLGALVALLSGADGGRRAQEVVLRGGLAGASLGLAATMRTESMVFAAVSVAVVCCWLVIRRQVRAGLTLGASSVLGFVVPWLANVRLESLLDANSRTERAADALGRDPIAELGVRFEEALLTWFGAPGGGYPDAVVVGLLFVGSVVLAVRFASRGERRASTLVAAGGLVLLLAAAGGLAFVPGALVASPLAIVALVPVTALGDKGGEPSALVAASRRSAGPGSVGTVVMVVALVTTLLTWLYQYTGGALPQWGGRYLLGPTMVLTTVGIVRLGRIDDAALRTVCAMAVVVSVFGTVFAAYRTHEVERFFEAVSDGPEDVIISTNGFLVREAGREYDKVRYLSVSRGRDVVGAVEVLERARIHRFGVLSVGTGEPDLDIDGVEQVGAVSLTLLDVPFTLHRYER